MLPSPFASQCMAAARHLIDAGKAPTSTNIAAILSGGGERKQIRSNAVGLSMHYAKHQQLVIRKPGPPPEWWPID